MKNNLLHSPIVIKIDLFRHFYLHEAQAGVQEEQEHLEQEEQAHILQIEAHEVPAVRL